MRRLKSFKTHGLLFKNGLCACQNLWSSPIFTWFEFGTQIHQILSQHPLTGFSEPLVTTFRQHIQLISTLSEGIVGSALELALFKSGSVHAAFEAMVLLDASLEKYHRGGETLLSELLPRTMLRHQTDYEALSAELVDKENC